MKLNKNMFKKILFLAMMVIITTSCDNTTRNIKEKLFSNNDATITYYRDCRTGLCFAEIVQAGMINGHTTVPCDSVKSFLIPCEDESKK